jgi:anti-sigma B factor antagonist
VSVSQAEEVVISAPDRLIAENRAEFRSKALGHIDRAAEAGAVVVVDLQLTKEIDSSGLGLLVLVEKRSRERGLRTVLRGAGEEVRSMLAVTRLEMLFTIED